MSVAIKKIDGVQDVKVSLEEGTADVMLKEGNKVTVQQVRDVMRKNGFTPKQSEVKVLGKVSERNGKPALEVTGLDVVYLLDGDLSKAKGLMGKEVVVSGEIPESAAEGAARTLHVKELSAAGP